MLPRFALRSLRDTAGLGMLVSALAGCPLPEVPMLGDGSSSGGPSTNPGSCIPGQQISCSCPGTVDGIQVCTFDGSGYEPCQCDEPPPPADSTGTGDPSGTDTGTTGTTTSTTSTTSGSSSTTDGSESTGTTGDPAVCDMYMGGAGTDCDPWLQDCPAGEKCIAYAQSGNSWNATHCWPVDNSPGQPGDVCTVTGSGTSGQDDCDLGAMCWDVDAETNTGVCVALCSGCPDEPYCDDPATACVISNNDVLTVCLPTCDPLLQDCAAGQACYPVNDVFLCAPDASGELGVYGDPCEYINACDPGLVCLDVASVPGCAGIGCCSEICDVTDPSGDAQCTGFGSGQQCVAWYAMGTAPPGYEDVGICTL